MRKFLPVFTLALALATVASLVLPATAEAQTRYRVQITNLTRAQIFSPPLVVSHSAQVALFQEGRPAAPELATLAEDGDPSSLVALLSTLPQVRSTAVADGPVLPGQTTTVFVETEFPQIRISAVGMLVQTNDTFFAVDSATLPVAFRTGEHFAVGFDAGSEFNNESCDFIPGPPCGSGGVRATDGAEGYVHVNNGIHGIGDLSAAVYDWRNPVARVTIRQVRE